MSKPTALARLGDRSVLATWHHSRKRRAMEVGVANKHCDVFVQGGPRFAYGILTSLSFLESLFNIDESHISL